MGVVCVGGGEWCYGICMEGSGWFVGQAQASSMTCEGDDDGDNEGDDCE